ncbi:hypothetical protein NIES4103_17780 [Nostoc sp. NIES-4103]|nr:hypothetical protein NIES4103_17780 [Nostoc sp. NIES-4103]
MDILFDVSFHFDDNLHEVPNSPAEMQQAVKFLQSQLNDSANDTQQQISLNGLIGSYARILRDFSTAKLALTSALELCSSINDKRLKVINLIRLGHLYQWQQEYSLSETLFFDAIAQCINNPELESYLDFAYQHIGKCKFDQAQYEQAQFYFEKALELRKFKNNQLLIDSTQLALDTVKQHCSH